MMKEAMQYVTFHTCQAIGKGNWGLYRDHIPDDE